MKLIGRGAFTKAYLLDNGRVLLKSCDPIKEAMAHGWFPDSPLFPKVSYIDVETFEMDYLTRVRAPKRQLNERAYALYQALRDVSDVFCRSLGNKYDGYKDLYYLFETLLNGWEEKETLLEALNACADWGSDVSFEISPRNISTNDKGDLILADCFFMMSKLEEVRTK